MNYEIIQPSEKLADYVRFIWCMEGNISFTHYAFAHHCTELIFCYRGRFNYQSSAGTEKNHSLGIYGQTESLSKIGVNGDVGIIGIYLYPHAVSQLFCIPANEITNQAVDIKTLLGKEAEVIENRLMLALDNGQRLKYINDFLEARLKNVKPEFDRLCSSIKLISTAYNDTSVALLAENNFLSLRQFERRFKELSGFSPKLFLRIARFNALLNKPFRNKLLADIASDFGYYDISHFIHDFQKFSGRNPKQYFNPGTIAASDRGTVEFS